VAEDRHVSGRALLTAVAVGLETTTRIGLALNYGAFHARGWHAPGVIGPFGGAAAVGALLGLDGPGHRNALGLAGSQSAGTMAQWGTPTIKFHQARGSVAALLGGLLAAEGFTAGADVVADPNGGILSTYSDGGHPDALTDGLGERWELEQISLKRWPAGSGLQTMITSLLALIGEHDLEPGVIDAVRVTLPSGAYRAHGTMGWESTFTAQLSARYVAAFARDRVEITEDASLGPSEAVIDVDLRDGTSHRDRRAMPKGDPSDPLDVDEVVGKLREAGAGVLADTTVAQLVDGLLSLQDCDDVTPLIRLLGRVDGAGAT
jgi:2-methylcitrate dehydratase PrpD